jgi:hypothetical protein
MYTRAGMGICVCIYGVPGLDVIPAHFVLLTYRMPTTPTGRPRRGRGRMSLEDNGPLGYAPMVTHDNCK